MSIGAQQYLAVPVNIDVSHIAKLAAFLLDILSNLSVPVSRRLPAYPYSLRIAYGGTSRPFQLRQLALDIGDSQDIGVLHFSDLLGPRSCASAL